MRAGFKHLSDSGVCLAYRKAMGPILDVVYGRPDPTTYSGLSVASAEQHARADALRAELKRRGLRVPEPWEI